MASQVPGAVTAMLENANAGDSGIFDRLFPIVYDELHEMAHARLFGHQRGQTLNTTALVHEAYFKLVNKEEVTNNGRTYFFGAASRAMRQVLVDYARRRRRKKRGGSKQPITLEEGRFAIDVFSEELLDLDAALDRLESFDERAARVVECRFFGGLSVDETADVLDIAPRTVKRDWAAARAWLFQELHG